MTVHGLPHGIVPGLPGPSSKTGKTSGARRSLLDQGAGAAAGLAAFRRLDLTTHDAAAIGQNASDGHARMKTAPGARTPREPLDPGASSPARTADVNAPSDGPSSGLRGLLGALATGRISLLPGALGFLAQVFGQRPENAATAPRASIETDAIPDDPVARARDVSRALSSVTANPETNGTRAPSRLETRSGVRAYDLVNRLVGSPNDVHGTGGIEFALPLPFGRTSTSVDQVA